MVQAAGTTFAVTAAQLATDHLHGRDSGLGRSVRECLRWQSPSAGRRSSTSTSVNNAPTVTAPNQTASSGQVLNASSLFTANDADGDSLLYFFYDNSAAADERPLRSQRRGAGGRHDLRGDGRRNWRRRTFVAGTTGDDLFVNVWDGVGLQRTEGVPRRRRVRIVRAADALTARAWPRCSEAIGKRGAWLFGALPFSNQREYRRTVFLCSFNSRNKARAKGLSFRYMSSTEFYSHGTAENPAHVGFDGHADNLDIFLRFNEGNDITKMARGEIADIVALLADICSAGISIGHDEHDPAFGAALL